MADSLEGIPVVVSYDQPGYVFPSTFRFRPNPSPIPDGRIVFENPGGLYGPGGRQRLHMNERTHAELLREVARG